MGETLSARNEAFPLCFRSEIDYLRDISRIDEASASSENPLQGYPLGVVNFTCPVKLKELNDEGSQHFSS